MTTSEFLDLYLSENILDIFEETCEFFSQELPNEFIEEYDIGEVLIETRAKQETAKNIDNVIRFTTIVKENHPDLYLEFIEFFDDFLVDYYCYLGEEDKVREAFAHFQAHPQQSLDTYLLVFNQLVNYQHTGIIHDAVSENFYTINEFQDSYGYPEYELASIVFSQTLEELYLGGPNGFDHDEFSDKLSEFNYEFQKESMDNIEKGLLHSFLDPEELNKLFQYDKQGALYLFELYFYRHMYEKEFPFYLSNNIWDRLSSYWKRNSNHNENSVDSYFEVTSASLEEFIFDQMTKLFFDNSAVALQGLWGSVYVYEFLYQLGIIRQEIFDDFLKISRYVKGRVIAQYSTRL